MRLTTLFGLVVLLLTASLAQARPVHFFDCKDCHTATVDLYALGSTNLCLKCHKDTPPAVTFNDSTTDHKPNGLFHPNDASDALASATTAGMTPTQQTSHFWAAKKDAVPAAGALAPTKTLYTSRYGISTGKVTCTRCHDPHLPIETDPKLLRMTVAGDLICLDCHRPWKLSNNRGRETHPIVADYAAVVTANPTKYNAVVTNVGSGAVQLVGGGVSCSSCHGVHFTDSHSGTVDGRDNRTGLLAGDGKLLRADGPQRTGADAAATSQLRSNLCQACHTYKTHGANNPIGCLECHSGHSYNNGTPNYFVLRGSIASVYVPKNSAVGAVNNLQFTTATAEWMNAGGTGYCQSCHTLTAPHNGHNSGNGASASCGECHYHNHVDRSFTASCNDCHGTPPVSASPAPAAGGYAKSGSFDYSTSGVYKDESLTPHGNHAGGSDYGFSCDVCHLGKSHATGSFQDVFLTPHALASGAGGTVPAYNGTGSGTCSAVYCHSNGGKRTGDASRSYTTVAVTWAGQKNTINSCDACHGNSAATMLVAGRDNSSSHQKHLAKGYDCSVCHANTASSATALVGGAIGTTHVNGSADVSYDVSHELSVGRPLGGGSYGTDGTCSIYCHSNGQGVNATPDWDVTASGACGTCHAARPGDAAVISSGSHSKHVSDLNGPQLDCDACHGAGAATGGHATHVNGMVNAPAASICTTCHAVDAGETTPVWGNSATSSCESCHSGATVSIINSKTAPAKPLAASSGHNLPSGSYALSGNPAANKTCVACHDAASAGHFGTSGDSRLAGGFDCSSCHATVLTHQAKSCTACHDPHGSSNGSMIYSTQTAQNAKDASASGKFGGDVVFAATTGADSYDEVDGVNTDDICASCHTATSHNNRTATGFHRAGDLRGSNCTQCHTHAKAFRPVGTSCNQCHGNAPSSGAHSYHALVADQTTAEDRSDCAACHTGAELYTYDPMDDIVNGRNHSDAAGRKTALTASVGYNTTDKNCTSACHQSTLADGAWNDADGLNCDACHYWNAAPTSAGNAAYVNAGGASAPLGAKHSKHFALSMVCGDCHGTVDTDLNFKRNHNNFKTAATDAAKIRYQGYGYFNPTGTAINVDDSTYNAAVNSWVNSAVTNDVGNTCANAACHNPSKTTYKADWDSDVASCSLCHSATDPATGAHGKHLTNRNVLYGGNLGCTTCHVDNGVNTVHRNGSVNLWASANSTCHSCHAQQDGSCAVCHTGASGVVNIWQKTGVVSGCNSCHAQNPISKGHAVHRTGTYGPVLGSDCSACHQSPANNTSMSGFSTHMNLKVSFRNRAVPASPYEVTFGTLGQAANDAVDTCNACHGGAAAALIAKDYWTITTRVSCESCHGDYSAATRNADGSGVAAPTRAGSGFDSYGHGKVTTNPTYGGKQCADCHENASAHISGSLGDTKRLKVINGKNFQNAGQENQFCGVCHAFAATAHFANSQTSGGGSLEATYCYNCHDVHGQNGSQDAMLRSNIGGRIVIGFTSKAARASYFVASPNSGGNNQYGICQVCHDPAEVNYFNTATGNDAGHNPGQVCTNCHKHDDTTTAFRASCDSCHGSPPTQDSELVYQLNAVNDTGSRTWGEHQKHATTLGYGCSTCHNGWDGVGEMPKAGNINIGFNAFSKTTGTYDGRSTGNYTAGTGLTLVKTKASGTTTCAFYCHGYQVPQWNPAATAACGACHGEVGSYPDDRAGAPTGIGASRSLAGALTGFKVGKHLNHLDDSIAATGDPCALCHNGAGYSDATHVNGTTNISMHAAAGGSAAFTPGAPGTCSNLSCHGDAPWDSAATGGCDFCHGGGGQYWPNGSAYPDRTGRHDKHLTALATKMSITLPGTDAQQKRMCAYCHNDATGVGGSGHNANGGSDSTADLGGFNPIWDTTNPPTVVDASSAFVPANGGCNSIDCHNNTATGSTTYGWRNAGTSTCTMCHSVDPTADTTHTAHTGSAATYGRTIVCTDCHNATTWGSAAPATGHLDGQWTIVGNSIASYGGNSVTQTKGGCGTNACHENGLGAAPVRNTYIWGTALANDCASCHAAAMTSNAHAGHLVSNVPELKGTVLTFNASDDCVVCHNTTTSGTGRASGSAHLNNVSNLAFKTTYNYEATTAGRAAGTAGTTTCSNILCHNGVTTPTWGSGAISCGKCHGDGSGPLPNQTNVTRSHPYHANNDTDYTDCDKCHGASGVTVSGTYTAVGGGGAAGLHQNLTVDMWINGASNRYSDAVNTSGGVNFAPAGATHIDDGTCSTTLCHGAKVPQWGVYVETVSGCRVCHDPTYASYDATSNPLPPAVAQVTAAKPHTDPDGAGVAYAAGDCRGCHAGHNQGVAIALPPTSWPLASGETHVNGDMKSLLGFGSYTGTDINIGGPSTSPTDSGARPLVHAAIRGKTTEAEVCWSCHDALATKVSEWGFNTKATPTGFPVIQMTLQEAGDTTQESFNYGWLFTSNAYGTKTSNWVAGGTGGTNPWWRSPYDNTLKQRVASVHAVGFDTSGHSSSVAVNVDASGNVNNKYADNAILEGVAQLRCAYCHDVHDTVGPNAKPYVRGTWIGNPYPVDLPPRSGYTYPTTGGGGSNTGNKYVSGWGAPVPRLYATYNYGSAAENQKLKGGFFIDQNSNNPTANAAMNDLPKTAGLCTICHGSTVNTMDFYTGSKLWRSTQTNGHANSTIGGTGTGKANIFDARRTYTTTRTMGNQGRVPVTGSGAFGGSPPGTTYRPDYPWANFMNPNSFASGRARNSGWFGTTAGSTTGQGGDYTNWYSASGIGSYTGTAGQKAHNFTCSKCHSPHAAPLPALLITNCLDATVATWSAHSGNITPTFPQANNCHRKESGTPDNSGWHRLNAGQKLP